MTLPQDMPDNYPWLPGAGRAPLQDIGELAARLGSPVVYDRRGAVYFTDDFENGLIPWMPGTDGTGAAVDLVSDHVFRGTQAARLTGGSDLDRRASVGKRLSPSILSAYGLESTFSIDTDVENVFLSMQYNTGVKRYYTHIRLNPASSSIVLAGEPDLLETFSGITIPSSDPDLFQTAKIVVDFAALRVIRFMYNQMTYDLTGRTFTGVADATNPRIEITVAVKSTAGNNGIIYVDNVIATIGDV